MKMKLKINIFSCNLYPFNIDVHFKHENSLCTLPNFFNILKQYNYLQIYIRLYGWKKDNGTMVSIFKYPQWILRWLENFFLYDKCDLFF